MHKQSVTRYKVCQGLPFKAEELAEGLDGVGIFAGVPVNIISFDFRNHSVQLEIIDPQMGRKRMWLSISRLPDVAQPMSRITLAANLLDDGLNADEIRLALHCSEAL